MRDQQNTYPHTFNDAPVDSDTERATLPCETTEKFDEYIDRLRNHSKIGKGALNANVHHIPGEE